MVKVVMPVSSALLFCRNAIAGRRPDQAADSLIAHPRQVDAMELDRAFAELI
jgi:hypothetical protein